MLKRRSFITASGLAAGIGLAESGQEPDGEFYKARNGRIQQSVVHWCFTREPNALSVEQLAAGAAPMGVTSVELVGPEHWPTLKKHGLTCAIAGSHGFAKGFAHVEEHGECIARLRQSIDACVAHGVKSVITFSGFRRGLPHEEAMTNMIAGLKKIVPFAEDKKVALCLEMLNSRVAEEMKGHPDYWCDHIDYALEICKKIGSPQMKILFDIYHVQIMDGDVIQHMRECGDFIGHVHTAGNPGRHELDDEQEINYPGIMKALAQMGYKGFVGQEFIPRNPRKLAALNHAVKLCDV
ncbi:MAG: hydroxypyruvate isomerase family protein [Verrucomicrobiales bacterium]